MPGILATTKWSRRRFLRGTVQAAACAAYPSLAHAADPPQSRRWTLLADTHVAADPLTVSGVGGQKPYENLQKTVERIGADPPVGAMIIGDVALSDGQPGDYAAVKTLLKPLSNKVPVFLGMGNHDDREPFLEAFPDGADGGPRPPVKQKHIVVIDQAPVIRIVLLDSLWHVNRVPGELGRDQQTWLQEFLTKSDPAVPVAIAVHHTLGRGWGDLQDAQEFFQIIERAPQVKAVFYGHSHRFQITERESVHLVNLPPVGYAFDAETALGWLDATFAPGGCELTRRTLDEKSSAEGSRTELTWRK